MTQLNMTDDQIIDLANDLRDCAILERDPDTLAEFGALRALKQIFPRLAELAFAARQHKKLSAAVNYNDRHDMLRLASLYTHDLARPISTNGEIALGQCVETLVKQLDEIDRHARQLRQETLFTWARAAFGEDEAASPRQRAIRLLEEAIEAYQAVDGDRLQALDLVNFVFTRPKGEIAQELGGVAVCVLLLAEATSCDADKCEQLEIERIFSKPIAHYTARNAAKNAAGFLAEKPEDAK